MSRFNKAPLKALERIYEFIGRSSPQLVDVEGPITLVHDVSREAELGTSIGVDGYFIAGTTDIHVTPGTLFDAFDPYDSVATEAAILPGLQVWIISAMGITTSTPNFVSSAISLSYPIIAPAFATAFQQLLFFFPDPVEELTGGVVVIGDNARPANRVPLPQVVPFGGTIRTASESQTGNVNISQNVLFWAGPRGTRPPGLA